MDETIGKEFTQKDIYWCTGYIRLVASGNGYEFPYQCFKILNGGWYYAI